MLGSKSAMTESTPEILGKYFSEQKVLYDFKSVKRQVLELEDPISLTNNSWETNDGTGKGLTNTSQPSESPKKITSSRDCHDPLAIWRAGPTMTRLPYGELVHPRPAHHMASWVVSFSLVIWWPGTAPYQCHALSSCLFAFSFEARLHFLLFHVDWSYRWNFMIKTAKACFLKSIV